jgi:hypothetical protein
MFSYRHLRVGLVIRRYPFDAPRLGLGGGREYPINIGVPSCNTWIQPDVTHGGNSPTPIIAFPVNMSLQISEVLFCAVLVSFDS